MASDSPRFTIPSIIAATVAAVAASVCCVVPLVLVLAGISGAWIGNLAALDAWRPWFTAATLIALGAAFWSAYRRPAACEGPSCSPRRVKRHRAWLWAATVVIVGLLAFPYYAPFLL